MREIKFRAWDKDRKSMSDGWSMKEWLYAAFQQAEYFEGVNKYVEEFFEKLVFMQFTGLHDKNGKEIYEGDIIRHRKLNKPSDGIMYGLAEQMLQRKSREVKYECCGFTPLAGWIDDAYRDMEWEIIGNIYENPELLDGGQSVKPTDAA